RCAFISGLVRQRREATGEADCARDRIDVPHCNFSFFCRDREWIFRFGSQVIGVIHDRNRLLDHWLAIRTSSAPQFVEKCKKGVLLPLHLVGLTGDRRRVDGWPSIQLAPKSEQRGSSLNGGGCLHARSKVVDSLGELG